MAMPEAAAAAMAAAVAIFTRGEGGEPGVGRLHLAPSRPKPRLPASPDAFEFGADLAAADGGQPDGR